MPARTAQSVLVRPAPPYPLVGLCPPGLPACGRPVWRRALASGYPARLPLADVNECEAGVHQCRDSQVCYNLPGSYRCDCKAGFQQDLFSRTCVGRWALIAQSPLASLQCPPLPEPLPLPCSGRPALWAGLLASRPAMAVLPLLLSAFILSSLAPCCE